jgi:hypothetical protein
MHEEAEEHGHIVEELDARMGEELGAGQDLNLRPEMTPSGPPGRRRFLDHFIGDEFPPDVPLVSRPRR